MQRDGVPVWDVVEARIRAEAVYAPSFYVLLMLAGLIGAVGILTNSQILIVGAMVPARMTAGPAGAVSGSLSGSVSGSGRLTGWSAGHRYCAPGRLRTS